MSRCIPCKLLAAAILAGGIVTIASRSAQSQPASESPVWKQTAAIDAPEAVQAAAADERFLYAIANKVVAKYDRQTGERVATSSGDAHHLNSGFFWEGNLYCAHSNYPRQPERSELMVLDVESMQLTVFKEFGNYGGSLTWAVRHEDRWWCNFARYGEQNHATFLVQFDDQWRELARWTYPAEVTRELKNYSLSGGIFRDGELLVTGHDDRVVFRLRVPTEGKVLQYVDRQHVPFTGQGIAHDPVTGGLVGIQRSKKQILIAKCAAADSGPTGVPRLRVLTYNIHHGEGTDGKLDLKRIAQVISAVEPDLIALQEVDQAVERTDGVDQPAELARLTKMHAAFGGNIELQGGTYGNAVLSRWPIKSQKNHPLPCFENGEQRGVLDVEIEVSSNLPALRLLATHFDHRRDDKERIASAKAVNELLTDDPERPAILAGDLNDETDTAALQELRNQWQTTNDKELPTVPVEKPQRQIDFVLVRPAARWRVVEVRVLDEAVASDHRAVLAVIELLPPKVK